MSVVINGTGSISGLSNVGGISSPQSGSVIQVVNSILNNGGTSSTNTYVDTGLSVTITPKYATSTILVDVNMTSCGKDTNAAAYLQLNLQRNGVDILARTMEQIGAYTNPSSTQNWVAGTGTNYLDSPGTTSAVTYKVQARAGSNVGVVYWSYLSISTITAMEIAA